MGQQRQLVAIMFTDIEGYTAIMQQSEQEAMSLKNRHREILQKEHKQFNGNIIQYYGDGTLSIFQSAVHAMQCALAMQQAFCQAPHVPVRMGLHIGDIIFDDDQIFGDGVNLASRIESLGVPGSVLMSDKVNDEISNHPELKTISVGVYQFKNIMREVEVFALDHEGLVKPARNSLTGKTQEKKKSTLQKYLTTTDGIPEKSIAVLPFVNMSNDPEQEYFSDGMAEEILNSLSNLKDLKVAGRTSSFQFKGKNIDLREMGKKLDVSTVLEGSVRKQGNLLRVTVQLVNVNDGFHIWSEKYDRKMDDIFAIQDEIALSITEKLKVTLLRKDHETIAKSYTQNTEAYEQYLKGRFYMNRRGASVVIALQCFQQAINIDPDFALAHVGYADANLLIGFYALLPPAQVMQKAKQSAETVIKLNPSLCEPYCSLGFYYTCFEWNWAEAEKNFLKSIELNPRYAQAHCWYGFLLLAWAKGEFDNAEKQGQAAIELEPLSAICYGTYGGILHSAGKYKETLDACRSGIELDPNSFLCQVYAANGYFALQRYEEAIVAYEYSMKLSNRHQFPLSGLIYTYWKMGNHDKVRELMNEVKERSKKEYVANFFIAMSVAHMDNLDEAFEYLEKAFRERDPLILTLQFGPWVPDALKNDPRFQRLLDKIGFPH